MTEHTILRYATWQDAAAIENLLVQNLKENLSEDERADGYLTWHPNKAEIGELIDSSSVIVSAQREHLTGYAMFLTPSTAERNRLLAGVLEKAKKMIFNGLPIERFQFALFGQICIYKAHRGSLTFIRLHSAVQTELKKRKFELLIGAVAESNTKSLSAHRAYQDIGTFELRGTIWHLLVGDLRS